MKLPNPCLPVAFYAGAILVLAVSMPSAKAITIDFDTGYSTTGGAGGVGAILGQPSSAGTVWTGGGADGTTGALLVTAHDGKSGSDQSAKSQAGNDKVKYASYTFKPTDADLGGTFDPSSSVIDYSFDLKLDGTPNTGTVVALRIYIGGVKGAHFDLLTNGALCITTGQGDGKGKPLYAKASDVALFHANANGYFTVSGTVNYATKTFTASVDGVPQNVGGVADLGFLDKSDTEMELELINVCCAYPNWIPVSIDNIKLSLEAAAPSAPAKP